MRLKTNNDLGCSAFTFSMQLNLEFAFNFWVLRFSDSCLQKEGKRLSIPEPIHYYDFFFLKPICKRMQSTPELINHLGLPMPIHFLKINPVMDGLWDWQPFSLFWVDSGFTCLKDMNADHLKSFALFGGFVGFFNGEKGQGWRAPGDCKSVGRCFDVKRFEGWRPP